MQKIKKNHFLAIILSCVVVLCSSITMAQEVVIGHVVSVNRDTGEFILQVTDEHNGLEKFITITKAVNEKFLFLPKCVEPGNFVRIWGDLETTNNNVFHADIVRGPSDGSRDSSGIRSRINRGMSRQYGRQQNRSGKKNH